MSLLITREDFIKRYGTPATQIQVKLVFTAWDKFLKDRKYDETEIFLEMRSEENKMRRYTILDQCVQFWNEDKHPHTVKNYFNFLKAWVKYNEVELDNDKIRGNVKFRKAIRERVRGIDASMIRALIDLCTIPIYKALWYVQTYGGKRIKSESLNMRWSWIDFTRSPLMVTIPGEHAKTGQERITFLALEAEKWLREERERRKDEPMDSFVFQVQEKDGSWRKITYNTAYQYFAKRRKKLGFTEKGANGWYHFRPHKIRGYTENKLGRGSGGPEFAHSILGHTDGLIEYNQGGITDEDARKDYTSAIQYLALSDEARYKDEAERYKEQAEFVEDLKRKLIESEMRIKRLEDMGKVKSGN